MSKWRSIDTAPKDKWLLVSDGDTVFEGKFSSYRGGYWMDIEGIGDILPTHWMLKPDPPREGE